MAEVHEDVPEEAGAGHEVREEEAIAEDCGVALEAAYDPAVVAIQLILPGCSEESIRQALEEHAGDPDSALEALLGGGGEEAEAVESPVAAALTQPASAEEPARREEIPKGPSKVQNSSAKVVTAEAPHAKKPPADAKEAAGKTAEPEPSKPDGPPPWLPMMRPQPTGDARTYYEIQSDRLKAALGKPAIFDGQEVGSKRTTGGTKLGGG